MSMIIRAGSTGAERLRAPARWIGRAVLCIAAVALPAATADAATWYVRKSGSDLNTGASPAEAFLTISQAASLVAAGDTVYVGAGFYPELVQISAIGTVGAPISFIADTNGQWTGDAGIVSISGQGNREKGFELDGCSYVRIVGFHIEDTNQYGIEVTNATGVTVESCQVHGNGTAGIKLTGEGCLISRCNVYSNTQDGITVHGLGEGSTVSQCVVYGNGQQGIAVMSFLGGAPCKVTVVNCISYGNQMSGIVVNNLTTGTLWNNTCVSNGSNGIMVNGAQAVATATNNISAYNGKYGVQSNGTFTGDYNLFWQNSQGDYKSVTPGLNDILVDPLFVDQAGNDYHLAVGSPAINAGTATGAPTVDFENRSRKPKDGLIDIGADERKHPPRVKRWVEVFR